MINGVSVEELFVVVTHAFFVPFPYPDKHLHKTLATATL